MTEPREDEIGSAALDLSVVSPMFNEAEGIGRFLLELRGVLDASEREYEVIIVDDGSADDSIEQALSLGWAECRVVSLACNYGHQVALEAGMALARGRWVVTMDSDGQHPPDLIPDMLDAVLQHDVDVVYTVQRERVDAPGKRFAALAYYRLIRALTGISVADSQADFRLVSRRVLLDIRQVPGDKVLRLLLPAIGYRSVTLDYRVRDRIAGAGRFGLVRQLQLAASSLLNFSAKPLRMVAGLGLLLAFLAFVWLVYVSVTFLTTRTVTGWSSVMAAVLVVGGITLLSVSIVGEYVARIHDLLRAHPRYASRIVSAAGTGDATEADS